jgi:hypothetical protein
MATTLNISAEHEVAATKTIGTDPRFIQQTYQLAHATLYHLIRKYGQMTSKPNFPDTVTPNGPNAVLARSRNPVRRPGRTSRNWEHKGPFSLS